MKQWILALSRTKSAIPLSAASFMSSQCLKDKVGSTTNSFRAVLKHDRHLYRRGVFLPRLIIFITQRAAYKWLCHLSHTCADFKYCALNRTLCSPRWEKKTQLALTAALRCFISSVGVSHKDLFSAGRTRLHYQIFSLEAHKSNGSFHSVLNYPVDRSYQLKGFHWTDAEATWTVVYNGGSVSLVHSLCTYTY